MINYNYKKGNLIFDDLNIKKITEEIKTPFYCYSLNYLKDQYSSLDNSINLKDYEICYAVKSNSNQSIIKNFANMGSGADVVSIGEMKRALKASIAPNKIVFSGVGKNSYEIKYALENNILMFNVESVSELKKISDQALLQSKKAPIAIRINPDISAGGNEKISTGKAQDKFGISWKDAYEVYEYASTLPGIEIKGIDAHIGSQINQLEPFSHSFDKLKEITSMLKDKGIKIDIIDVGGGLGVKYKENETPIDVKKYGKLLSEKLGELNCKVIIEPGRFLTANAGILVTKILHIKKSNIKNFVIVDAGMNDFIRPTLYGAHHNIIPLKQPGKLENLKCDIVGPVCETGDFFAKDIDLKDINEDDFLAICSTGAYGSVQSSNYNTRASIDELLVNNGEYEIIRKRIDEDSIIDKDIISKWV
jgi:diaminopimelate decarboxylase